MKFSGAFLLILLFQPNAGAQLHTIQVELKKGIEVPGIAPEDTLYTQNARYPGYKKIVTSNAVIRQALLKVEDPDKKRVTIAQIQENLSVENEGKVSRIRFKTPYTAFGMEFLNALADVSLGEDQRLRYQFYNDSILLYEQKEDQLSEKIARRQETDKNYPPDLLSCLRMYAGMQEWEMAESDNSAEISGLNSFDLELEITNLNLILPEVETTEQAGKKPKVKVTIAARSTENMYLESRERKSFFMLQAMKITPRYLRSQAEVVE